MTDPAAPVLVAQESLPVSFAGLAAVDGYIFATYQASGIGNDGFLTLRYSQESGLIQEANLNGPFIGGQLAVGTGRAYSSGLVVDVSNPQHPFVAGTIGGAARPLAVSGNYLFTTDSSHAVRIFDASDPANADELVSFGMPGGEAIAVGSDGRIYVGLASPA